MAALSKSLHPVNNVLVAEATAMREGLNFAQDIGLDRLIVESDSAPLLDLINKKSFNESDVRVVVDDVIKSSHLFDPCVFQFVSREGNRAAHLLAQNARERSCLEVWLESNPPWIDEVVCQEMTNANDVAS